ncbi:DNA cytosine methyltransferase [Acidisoma cellulosilytica]|uniref:DNA (cytosine-5-)-methyltransferase n=1 Tax=Acidisoma cellulosilyticum TaxID=2802395 RepID=A0A964E4Q7_9PROT|nr:DNA cytosine methyltransferase [Acidisoma cellulosilyticum]MCB8881731.1 DNA cytosine methyltransferase [Acidisoma cellulosilyticum]
MYRLRAISLFSGAGGFCAGIERAGYQIAVAVEKDRSACQTYRANFPSVPLYEGDIQKFLAPKSGHGELYGLQEIDLCYGGPPCQGHSSIGARDADDERNGLWVEFARIIDSIRPKSFIMENVPGILSSGLGKFKREILQKFQAIGYSNVTLVQVDASDFGAPQIRKRVLFVGTRDDLRLSGSLDGLLKSGLDAHRQPVISVDEAISDLPEAVCEPGEMVGYASKPSSDYQRTRRSRNLKVSGHHTKRIGPRRANLIAHLAAGQNADSLPPELWDGVRAQKWRRLDGSKPSHTLLAQMGKDLSEWIHPHFSRWLTLREAARIQGFPDNFGFPCSESEALKQVGNSVPPPLAYAVGLVVKEILGGAVIARKRGRPTKGVRPMTGGERHRRWRETHGSVALTVSPELAERIRLARDELCLTTAELLGQALDALVEQRRPRLKRAA